MFDKDKFREEIMTQGYAIVEDILSPAFMVRAKAELELAIKKEVEYHKTNQYADFGMVLLCSLYGGAFIELFDNNKLIDAFNAVLGDGCIVYAYTSSSMPPNKSNYSNRLHVDSPRLIPGYVTNMGATILLDDFTEEKPSEDEFYKNGKRVIAKAGSVWFFNARIWHAGGNNLTDKWRHALTINMCRPYMKQRIDIPRAMSHMDLSRVSQQALQKLGFLAQVPANYDEYYVAPEKRKFKQPIE
jgi:ectoine hydroxylase-related dioxygenase (phytanoyl-CoA dioxygenase family)